MGDAYPGAALEPRHGRQRRAQRRRAIQRRARGKLFPDRERCSTRGGAIAEPPDLRRRGVQAARHLRRAARFRRGHRRRAPRHRRSRGVRARDAEAAGKGAREERVRGQERTGVRLRIRRVPAGTERGRRSLRGLHDDDGQRHAGDCAVRQGSAAGEGAEGRLRGLCGARTDAVLRRSRRTGVGRRRAPRGRVWRVGARRRACRASRRACRGCIAFS